MVRWQKVGRVEAALCHSQVVKYQRFLKALCISYRQSRYLFGSVWGSSWRAVNVCNVYLQCNFFVSDKFWTTISFYPVYGRSLWGQWETPSKFRPLCEKTNNMLNCFRNKWNVGGHIFIDPEYDILCNPKWDSKITNCGVQICRRSLSSAVAFYSDIFTTVLLTHRSGYDDCRQGKTGRICWIMFSHRLRPPLLAKRKTPCHAVTRRDMIITSPNHILQRI